MSNEKGVELIKELVANRFSYHKIEKDLDIANGILGKVMRGVINLSDVNYRKIQGYFISKVLKMEPDVKITEALAEMDSLKARVKHLEAENAFLKEKIISVAQPEAKAVDAVSVPTVEESINNDEILEKIKAIKAEKCPKERDTPMGKKSWEMDQQKRIQELKNQLK